jgi:hypothetical protein
VLAGKKQFSIKICFWRINAGDFSPNLNLFVLSLIRFKTIGVKKLFFFFFCYYIEKYIVKFLFFGNSVLSSIFLQTNSEQKNDTYYSCISISNCRYYYYDNPLRVAIHDIIPWAFCLRAIWQTSISSSFSKIN